MSDLTFAEYERERDALDGAHLGYVIADRKWMVGFRPLLEASRAAKFLDCPIVEGGMGLSTVLLSRYHRLYGFDTDSDYATAVVEKASEWADRAGDEPPRFMGTDPHWHVRFARHDFMVVLWDFGLSVNRWHLAKLLEYPQNAPVVVIDDYHRDQHRYPFMTKDLGYVFMHETAPDEYSRTAGVFFNDALADSSAIYPALIAAMRAP